jgi:hypothetical protein
MKKIIPCTTIAALTAALIGGCGGGGGVTTMAPQATAPKIAQVADQTTPQDTPTGVLAVQLSDPDTPVDQLKLTANALDNTLVAGDGIVVGGTGANRTLQITPLPDAKGSTVIVLNVTDGSGQQSSSSFSLNITAVTAAFVSTTTTTYADAEAATPRTVNGLTFTGDVDTDPTAFDAQLQ